MRCLHLFDEHPRPPRRSIQLSTPQRTSLAFYEEALRRPEERNAFLSQLSAIIPAEPVIQRGIRKRVSKGATAGPRSSSDEIPSMKDRMAGVGPHPCVGHPRTSRSTPSSPVGRAGSTRAFRVIPGHRRRRSQPCARFLHRRAPFRQPPRTKNASGAKETTAKTRSATMVATSRGAAWVVSNTGDGTRSSPGSGIFRSLETLPAHQTPRTSFAGVNGCPFTRPGRLHPAVAGLPSSPPTLRSPESRPYPDARLSRPIPPGPRRRTGRRPGPRSGPPRGWLSG